MLKNPLNKVNLFIAFQYLFSRKKQSILAIIGVLLGVSIFIVMISFMTGVNSFLDDAVFNGSPDIIVSTKADTIKTKTIFDRKVSTLKKTKDIELLLNKNANVEAFSHQVISPAILISDNQQLPVSINGIAPEKEKHMADLNRRLISGQGFSSLKPSANTILLGTSLAKRLDVEVGDNLNMILPNGKRNQLQVSGIFSFGITTIDNIRTYVNSDILHNLLDIENKKPTHIHIKLKNRENLAITSELEDNTNNIKLINWQENNKTIVVGNKVRNVLTWSISFALLLIAGFGIYNILNITVIQKRKDIAVLKTMGYTSSDIVAIFLVQSFIIGVLGSILGGVFGYIISYVISKTPLDTADFIIVDTYPVLFNSLYYILGISFGILTSLFAGYFPSRKASKVDPVSIIRGI